MSVTILAVGAAGDLAGLVIPALVDRGALVRGLVRKPEQVQTAKDRGAHEGFCRKFLSTFAARLVMP
ncbi:hypothetical protein [Rhizobium sp. NZLR4b]|uniref:hypothetical protein n=1 Tax=Rhizobium sp. NZLR4b TaxID=2731102 RepID=UPI001C83B5F7|nr:hypothetical protein [Rhizobium sp. NZLR4b]